MLEEFTDYLTLTCFAMAGRILFLFLVLYSCTELFFENKYCNATGIMQYSYVYI